jgi:hypothetical protein
MTFYYREKRMSQPAYKYHAKLVNGLMRGKKYVVYKANSTTSRLKHHNTIIRRILDI